MHAIERAYLDEQDDAYAKWAAQHSEEIDRDNFERWAADRIEDGEAATEADYDDYLDSMLPLD